MNWLNYHHLLYFWVVAREGSIARACDHLGLAQPTISSQLRKLEKSLGENLFKRTGRNLVLTETGTVVYRYADEIFSLGRELTDVLRGRPTGSPVRFAVGVPDVLPKLVTYRLLQPALRMPEEVKLVCIEGRFEELLSDLALHRLDIVLSEAPIPPAFKIRAYSHLLGECNISLFATANLAKRLQRGFPQSLEDAPLLLPIRATALRRSLDQWFESNDIRPNVVGEFDDSALLKVFGQGGVGAFAAPSAIADEICRQYRVRRIGELPGLQERFYAISVERRLKHPAVVAMTEAARSELFGIGCKT
jgi:LysR family transcriptional activator of nhaA